MKLYSKKIREVLTKVVIPSDDQYIQKEQGKFEEYEESHNTFVKEIKQYRIKIQERFVLIDEQLFFLAEQNRQALEQHLEDERQILLLCIEDQEKVRNDLLLNWHTAIS